MGVRVSQRLQMLWSRTVIELGSQVLGAKGGSYRRACFGILDPRLHPLKVGNHEMGSQTRECPFLETGGRPNTGCPRKVQTSVVRSKISGASHSKLNGFESLPHPVKLLQNQSHRPGFQGKGLILALGFPFEILLKKHGYINLLTQCGGIQEELARHKTNTNCDVKYLKCCQE